jgi:hypothetical protein
MRKTVLFIILSIGFAITASSQCTPDPFYTDSVFGVWPDTTTNFPPGILNDPYFVQIDLKVPSNASQVPGFSLPPLPIDSGTVSAVNGLPPGLAYVCNPQTTAPCTFISGVGGCAVISGTPTQIGTYIISIELVVHLQLFGSPISYPITFEGYRIVVTETAVGIEELAITKTSLNQNQPNPFKKSTVIPFTLTRNETVKIKVMDLLGQVVDVRMIEGKKGDNVFTYEPSGLESGIYLYALETSVGVITKRMIFDKN